MYTLMIDSTVTRHQVLDHLDRCDPYSSLLAFARQRADLMALASWRSQLAAHMKNDHERAEYEREVLARLGGTPTSSARTSSVWET